MTTRSTGKRRRFEVLKRDGFACRYCGADATTTLLHVDHVIAVSEGGLDDDSNLITSCADCNLGKSNIPLDKSLLHVRPTAESIAEHTEQIKAYLEAVKARDAAFEEVAEYVCHAWETQVGYLSTDGRSAIERAVRDIGLDRSLRAVSAVARSTTSGSYDRVRYFCGVVRNMKRGD